MPSGAFELLAILAVMLSLFMVFIWALGESFRMRKEDKKFTFTARWKWLRRSLSLMYIPFAIAVGLLALAVLATAIIVLCRVITG